MEPRKRRAKLLLKDKKFREAKDLILDIANDDNAHNDYKIFNKLGDICMKLNEYDSALNYYQSSWSMDANNSLIYLKMANLYHEYLFNFTKASEMYEQCLRLDPLNEECYFNFGKLLMKQNKLDRAQCFFIKCKKERACINYHHALLLLKKNSSSDYESSSNIQNILKLLRRAAELMPNNIQYQHQYALCLENNGCIRKAGEVFEVALKLTEYKNVMILYDYSLYQFKDLQNVQSAIDHLDIALKLKQSDEYPQVKKQYNHLMKIIQRRKKHKRSNTSTLKLLIYDFDETITYHNLWRQIDGDFNKLNQMPKIHVTGTIFGGLDRTHRLHTHFQRILSSKENIHLAIVSNNSKTCIIRAIHLAGLAMYFNYDDILLSYDGNKLPFIKQLANKYNCDLSTEVLFIDNDSKNIDDCKDYCQTFHVFSDHTLNGLSMDHMKEIEELLGVYEPDQYDIEPPKNPHLQIYKINKDIYASIKREIGGVPE